LKEVNTIRPLASTISFPAKRRSHFKEKHVLYMQFMKRWTKLGSLCAVYFERSYGLLESKKV
jgi:hypothetical protein